MKKAIVATSILLFIVIAGLLYFKQAEVNEYKAEVNQYKQELAISERYSASLWAANEELLKEINALNTQIHLWRFDYKDTKLKEFGSVEELEQWLVGNSISENEYIKDTYDCDDFAVDLTLSALADGYWIGLGCYTGHMFNVTIMGNNIYKIEAESDKVDYWGAID